MPQAWVEKGQESKTYLPVRLPVDRVGGLELTNALWDERAYVLDSIESVILRTFVLVVVLSIIGMSTSVTST